MNHHNPRSTRLSRMDADTDFRWWLVPMALVLLMLAALFSWPSLSSRPDHVATRPLPSQTAQVQPAPAPVASTAYAATPREESLEDNHAATF